jgi:hypothetical protein
MCDKHVATVDDLKVNIIRSFFYSINLYNDREQFKAALKDVMK